jgi:hypothetical protein
MTKINKKETSNKKTMCDQFFTSTELSTFCYKTLIDYINKNEIPAGMAPPLQNYTFLEPSCGNGAFFYLLPCDRRIGYEIDVNLCKKHSEFICADFMNIEQLPSSSSNVIAIGNPPFTNGKGKQVGRKVNMQARFINKCAELGCKYVAFIVGASMQRLKSKCDTPNMKLVHSVFLPKTEFDCFKDGKTKQYTVYFNIYRKRTLPCIQMVTLQNIIKPDNWELVSVNNGAIDNIKCALVRWGAVSTIFNILKDTVLLKNLIEQERKKLEKYETTGSMITSSRYFFIQFKTETKDSVNEFNNFVLFVKKYAHSISTTTSTSIGMFEIYSLWNEFTNKKRENRFF